MFVYNANVTNAADANANADANADKNNHTLRSDW